MSPPPHKPPSKGPAGFPEKLGVPAKRPGGRSAKVRSAVLKAVFALLVEKGFPVFTIAEAASRAGVHETTIYRRWETRTALALDACLDFSDSVFSLPDKGSLAEDLAALASQVAAVLQSPVGKALLDMSVAADAHSADARRAFWHKRFEAVSPVVQRAIARGEIPADTNAFHVIEAAIAPLYFRALVSLQPIGEWPLRETVLRLASSLSKCK